MVAYAKIYRSMWDGTLGPRFPEWPVFVFMCAHSDPKGRVDMTPLAISLRSGIPIEMVKKAIEGLEAPDPESRSEAEGGRRIIRIDGHRSWGWQIVNYAHYRTFRDPEVEREKANERKRRERSEKVSSSKHESADVTLGHAPSRAVTLCHVASLQAEAEAYEEAEESALPAEERVSGVTSTEPIEPPSLDLGVEEGSGDRISVEKWFEDEFWKAYPRKRGRAEALKAMKRIFRGVSGAKEDSLGDAILAGLEHDKKTEWRNRDPDKIPYPATWLNQRRWIDASES